MSLVILQDNASLVIVVILSDKELRVNNRELVELGYELIYKLCHNDETSGPALNDDRATISFIDK